MVASELQVRKGQALSPAKGVANITVPPGKVGTGGLSHILL